MEIYFISIDTIKEITGGLRNGKEVVIVRQTNGVGWVALNNKITVDATGVRGTFHNASNA